MNKLWHDKHVLGRKAPLKERIAWHIAHQENCGCRPIPKTVQEAINKTKLAKKRKTK